MKLRNKRTGEIVDTLCQEHAMGIAFGIDHHDGNPTMAYYNSLTELNAEWCDYEEPKKWFTINKFDGSIQEINDDTCAWTDEEKESIAELGFRFETKEEAEKAVEKLKAFKRLKDKGFRFDLSPALGHCDDKKFDISIIGTMPAKWWYNDKVVDDIHYIFGGEE